MYPITVKLQNKKVVVVGGGQIAYRKVKGLVEQGAKVVVFAPSFYHLFEDLKEKIVIDSREIELVDLSIILKDSFIVIAATDNRFLNESIGLYCQNHNILCNVIDNQILSSFIVPSAIRRGDLLIAVSTNGKSPSLAKKIKKDLEAIYDESYEEYLEILGCLREKIVLKIKDRKEKEKLLRHIVTLDREELISYEKSYFND